MRHKGLFKFLNVVSVLLLVVTLFSCGGSGSGSGFTISGTVSGLDEGSFELTFIYQGDELEVTNIFEVTENESFTLDVDLPDNSLYFARINKMPENPAQHCVIE